MFFWIELEDEIFEILKRIDFCLKFIPRLTQLPRSIHHRNPVRARIRLLHKRDQILNCAHPEPPPSPKLQAAVSAHHAALSPHRSPLHLLAVLNQLAYHARGSLARQATEFHRGLGVALTGADAAVARAQREDVAGPPKRFGRGGGRGEGSAGEGAVVGRDAGGDGRMGGVDGKRVGGSVGIGVFENHLGQGEGSREGGGDGSTDQATGLRKSGEERWWEG